MPSLLSHSTVDAEAPRGTPPAEGERALGRAMTLIEILVVIGIVVIVAAISIPAIAKARRNGRTTQCLSNLRQIGTAFGLYAEMNGYRLPDPGAAGVQWEDMLVPLVQKNNFRCPEDKELFDSLGSSYDWRDTSDPATTLVGKQVLGNLREDTVLSFDALPGWHIATEMNAVLLNGSARSFPREECLGDLLKPVAR